MENTESIIVARGTHPGLTVLLFAAIVAIIVTSGSYFSKQRNASRDAEEGLKSSVVTISQSIVAQ